MLYHSLIRSLSIVLFLLPGFEKTRDPANLNTAAGVTYLSPGEKEVVTEINRLRSDPQGYAREILAPLVKNYHDNLFRYSIDLPVITREGAVALNECIAELSGLGPLNLLQPSKGLTMAANDHVTDQSVSGRTGHTGSDNSSLRDRIERYGEWKYRIAENIGYGASDARHLIVMLLIDDGLPQRGHRKTFLNPELKEVGVSEGIHPRFRTMCVMDFATEFKEKPMP